VNASVEQVLAHGDGRFPEDGPSTLEAHIDFADGIFQLMKAEDIVGSKV